MILIKYGLKTWWESDKKSDKKSELFIKNNQDYYNLYIYILPV